MKKKCAACGAEYSPEHRWMECPDCGKVYCPSCADRMSKESREIEKLRAGDAYTRLRVLCPSCSVELIH